MANFIMGLQKGLERTLGLGSTNRPLGSILFRLSSLVVFEGGHSLQPWAKSRFSRKISHRSYAPLGELTVTVDQGALTDDTGSMLLAGDAVHVPIGRYLFDPSNEGIGVLFLADVAGRACSAVITEAVQVLPVVEAFKLHNAAGGYIARGNVVEGAVYVISGSWKRDGVVYLAGSTMPLAGGLLVPLGADARLVVVDRPGWTLHPSAMYSRGWLPMNRLTRIGGTTDARMIEVGDPILKQFKAPWQRFKKSSGKAVFDARDLRRAIELNIELIGDDCIPAALFVTAMLDAYVRNPPAPIDMAASSSPLLDVARLINPLVSALDGGRAPAEETITALSEHFSPLDGEVIVMVATAWISDEAVRSRVPLATFLEQAASRYSA